MEQSGGKGQSKTVINAELQSLHKELSDLHDTAKVPCFPDPDVAHVWV